MKQLRDEEEETGLGGRAWGRVFHRLQISPPFGYNGTEAEHISPKQAWLRCNNNRMSFAMTWNLIVSQLKPIPLQKMIIIGDQGGSEKKRILEKSFPKRIMDIYGGKA